MCDDVNIVLFRQTGADKQTNVSMQLFIPTSFFISNNKITKKGLPWKITYTNRILTLFQPKMFVGAIGISKSIRHKML
ncbi:unnamed protein product [Rotaria socialis]